MSFAGLKVISFESRRAAEMAQLIRKQQGEPIVAPSMREAPIERNEEAFRFAERLFAGEFDMMILLTGVGTRILDQAIASKFGPGRFAEANTWHEVLSATACRPERRIAVQEYGKSSAELLSGLRTRGAEVTPVRVYQWELPEDTGPLREAAERIAAEEVDVALFTTSVQIDHLLRVAAEKGLEDYVRTAFSKMLVASVGPATTEALEENGIHPDFEPSHPKMGLLVQETAERAEALLKAKR
jgi:uroporphyrinogen-III synthase